MCIFCESRMGTQKASLSSDFKVQVVTQGLFGFGKKLNTLKVGYEKDEQTKTNAIVIRVSQKCLTNNKKHQQQHFSRAGYKRTFKRAILYLSSPKQEKIIPLTIRRD